MSAAGREPFVKSRFERALDDVFVMSAADASTSIEVRLVEVKARPAPPGYEQFSALFVGPPSPVWPQGTYRFSSERFGSADLFTVPLAPTASGASYEVCVTGPIAPGAD